MKFLSLGLLVLFTNVALARDCSYEVFTPKYLLAKLRYELREKQVVMYDDLGSSRIVREGGFVGELRMSENHNKTDNLLVLTDNRGLTLLSVREEAVGVNRREITIESGFENHPALSSLLVMKINGGGSYHYVGAQNLGITTFYSEFNRYWDNMRQALLAEISPQLPSFKSGEDRFDFACQTDPIVRLYTSLFSLTRVKGNYAVVGVVPSNYVYHRVLTFAQDTFGPTVRVNLSINGLLKQPEWNEAPRCY